ncbi:MAG: VapC toxin family PIN domain ribonuclease [Gemmatimonadales bacterium]
MKVFLDTNVLVSAFATRGLCEDVFRHVLIEHELLVGEVVLMELSRTLSEKFGFPKRIVSEIEQLLRELTVVASEIAGRADVLVTGDHDLLTAADRSPIPILDPRGFWSLMRRQSP